MQTPDKFFGEAANDSADSSVGFGLIPRNSSDFFGATPSANAMGGSPLPAGDAVEGGRLRAQATSSALARGSGFVNRLAAIPSMEDIMSVGGGGDLGYGLLGMVTGGDTSGQNGHASIASSPCHSSQMFNNNNSMYPAYLLANATTAFANAMASGHINSQQAIETPTQNAAPMNAGSRCPLCPNDPVEDSTPKKSGDACGQSASVTTFEEECRVGRNNSSDSGIPSPSIHTQPPAAPSPNDADQLTFNQAGLALPSLTAASLCVHHTQHVQETKVLSFSSGSATSVPASAAFGIGKGSKAKAIPVIDPGLIHLAIAKAQKPKRRVESDHADGHTTDMIRLGVCCMRKKLESPTMQAMLERFQAFGNFIIVRFEEHLILNEHPSKWPTVDVMIAFFSSGFPLEKAVEYADMHPHIFFITEPRNQRVLLDRRDVYNALRLNNVPHPRVVFCNRDGYRGMPDSVFEEHEDYIIVDGQRMDKPFVEKPVSSEDHKVQVYYKGGGMRKLFRKVGNKSSDYFPDVGTVRRGGSYIYEAFIETEDKRDIKCYTVGSTYVFAETRKAPTGDGVVLRREDGKEMREPIGLRGGELMAARKLIKVFRQIVCGFDILRQADGKFFVCDVNGWSFVKNVPEYVDNATGIMRDIFVEEVRKRGLHREFRNKTMTRTLLGVVGVMRHADRTPKQKVKIVVNVEPLLLAVFEGERKVKDEIVLKSGHPKLDAIYEVVCALLSSTPACSDDTDGEDSNRDRVVHGTITPVMSMNAIGSVTQPPQQSGAKSNKMGSSNHVDPSCAASTADVVGASHNRSPQVSPSETDNFVGRPLEGSDQSCAHAPEEVNVSIPRLDSPRDNAPMPLFGQVVTPTPSPGLPPNPDPNASASQNHEANVPLGTVLSAPASRTYTYGAAQEEDKSDRLRSIAGVCPAVMGSSSFNNFCLSGTGAGANGTATAGIITPGAAVNFSVRTGDNISKSVLASLRLMKEVLARQHEGLKVQVKPREWDDEGNCVEALLVCKWGGWLTEAGHKQAQMMGRHFLKRIFGVNELNSVQKSRYAVQTNNERRVIHTAVEFSSAMLGEPFDEKRCFVNENLLGKTLGAKDHMAKYSETIKKIFNSEDLMAIEEYLKLPGMSNIVNSPVVPDGMRTPRGAMQTMRSLIEALCQSFAHSSTSQVKLYRYESMALLRQRWTNLLNALYQKKTNTFDTTKIPDIFDNISYDVCYNQRAFKDQLDMYPLFSLAEALSTFISDGEFGITPMEKRSSATLFATPLLERITEDLRQIAQKQGPTMRMYFTSESHVTGLKNLLYNSAEPFLRMEEPMELHFLSHFVFKLYRYPDEQPDRQYQIEVHFSMGMDKNMFGIVQEHHVDYASVTPMIRIHNNLDLEMLSKVATQFASEANTASSTPGGAGTPFVEAAGLTSSTTPTRAGEELPLPSSAAETKGQKKEKKKDKKRSSDDDEDD